MTTLNATLICQRKRPHATLADAMTALRGMVDATQFRLPTGRVLHPYRCEVCGRWHLGNRVVEKEGVKT